VKGINEMFKCRLMQLNCNHKTLLHGLQVGNHQSIATTELPYRIRPLETSSGNIWPAK
jgi:hypothetical protein